MHVALERFFGGITRFERNKYEFEAPDCLVYRGRRVAVGGF